MGKIKPYTKKKRRLMGLGGEYYEETIYDDGNFESVKAVGKTKKKARGRAERKWRDKQLEKDTR